MKKPINKKQKAAPPVEKKPKAKPTPEKAIPIRAGDKKVAKTDRPNKSASLELKVIAKTAGFGRTLAKLRKARADGDVDAPYQRQVLQHMFDSTNTLIGICEKTVRNNPSYIKSLAYPYNSLVSQSREIMHDLRLLQMTSGTSEQLITVAQASMRNIVQSLVDLNAIYKAQVSSRVTNSAVKDKIDKDFNEMLQHSARVLSEHYKGLEDSIVKYFEPAGRK